MDINLLSLTVDWILPFSTWAMWLINVLHPLSFLYWSPNRTPFFFCNSHRLANLLKAISSCATKKDVLSRHWSAEKNFSLIWTTFLWTAASIGSVIVKKSSPKNLLADCRPTVGWQLVVCRPFVGRQTADRFCPKYRSGPTVGRQSADCWWCVGNLSVACR